MTLSEQTTTDLTSILDQIDQRIHEMTSTPEAVNTYDPAEVATMYDLRDYLGELVAG
ncbi:MULTISPECIES: hypothetical protein [unclassified Aliiroseovarius]|uniref:hypothetical protein n=1 Tax=unclassified Aliiroseovarius TaxID=2623558 RepID=UPI0015685EFE|nr:MULTISPECIES: hypothetical protein [unclassified Aliiroseovarius]NRP32039.1 hypothetical protein [Aliiroseovarius sp. xm-m-314]NRP81681.1 hypothetical protein [Aliiroseovarius sp. xm-v-209]NRQ12728.1 hypothetical protein [Aliiroseovarius sp. xm-v-208]